MIPEDICPETGKHRHSAKAKAEAHLRNLRKRELYKEGEGHPYLCDKCGGWHVGREKQNTHKNKYKE